MNNTKLKNLYLIIGPSGVGKSSLVDALRQRYGYSDVQSYTDRPPRFEGERGHTFLSKAEFDELEKNEQMCAYTVFNGYRYGVTEKMLENSDLYIIDPAGVLYMQERYHGKKPTVCIGMTQPWSVLEERMLRRGDDEQSVNRRIAHDKMVFAGMEDLCEAILNNEYLPDTVAFAQAFIEKKEHERSN